MSHVETIKKIRNQINRNLGTVQHNDQEKIKESGGYGQQNSAPVICFPTENDICILSHFDTFGA